MANEFSKGKWRTLEGKSGKGYFVVAGEDENHTTLVADCDVSILLSHQEKVANAKIISSAPDMLEALLVVQEFLILKDLDFPVVDKAIKKAIG